MTQYLIEATTTETSTLTVKTETSTLTMKTETSTWHATFNLDNDNSIQYLDIDNRNIDDRNIDMTCNIETMTTNIDLA